MKYFFSLFLSLFIFTTVIAQNGYKITPYIGLNTHSDWSDGSVFQLTGKTQKIVTSSVIGINIYHQKQPFSLSLEQNFYANIHFYDPTDFEHPLNIIWRRFQMNIHWQPKRIKYGLGHYWKQRENVFNFSGIPRKSRGIQLSAAVPIRRMEIGLFYKIAYTPFFKPLGLSQWSISFLHYFDKSRLETKQFKNTNWQLNSLVGIRFFPVVDILQLQGEEFPLIGTAPAVGLELIWLKKGLSISLEKDWWIGLNAGSPERFVKGFIANSTIMARYHLTLKNNRALRLGLGGAFVTDSDKRGKVTSIAQRHLFNHQVRGAAVSASYELFPNTDIEIRQIISIQGIDEPLVHPLRSSLGLLYRFQP